METYVSTIYFIMVSLSTVGYGDITPKNSLETLVAMFTMLFAGMVFAFNVGAIRETM
jgi:hypothetical protein